MAPIAGVLSREAGDHDRRRFRGDTRVQRGGASFTVFADARLDNRPELEHALGMPRGAAVPDLLVASYLAWGRGTPDRLVGDFAFVLWDDRGARAFCARDPVGVRPLYYHLSEHTLAFASSLSALRGLVAIPDDLDEVQIARFLEGVVEDQVRTFFRSIRRLPAGHWMEIGSNGRRSACYWTPRWEDATQERSDDAWAGAFREHFLEAVRARVEGPGTVASALSGGLDSSSIVAAARRVMPAGKPLHAFSAVFPGLPDAERARNDESTYIDCVAAADGIVSHRIRADSVGVIDGYDRVLEQHGQPVLGFNLYMDLALFEAAREHGVTAFLDGTDGDSVVGYGMERLGELLAARRWNALTAETHALARRFGTSTAWFAERHVYPHLGRLARSGRWLAWTRGARALVRGLDAPWRSVLLRHGVKPLVPRRILHLRRAGRSADAGGRGLMRRDFARRVRLDERRTAAATRPESRLDVALLQYGLELMYDAGAVYGLELRYPFLDRRLIDFCSTVPPTQRLRDGWTRWIQRRAMEGLVPDPVRWRVHKGDLAFNFIRGMRRVAESGLGGSTFAIVEDFVDLDHLAGVVRRLSSSASGPGAGRDAMHLYQAVMLARWMEGR